METTKKVLSDGTIAEEGMIVVVMEGTDMDGNDPNTITKIIDITSSKEGNLLCHDTNHLGYNPCFWENPLYLRKATPEEELIFKERSF